MYFLFLIDFFKCRQDNLVFTHTLGDMLLVVYIIIICMEKQQTQPINQNLDIESNYYQNKKIDDILDKIGQSGYESLSDEEKEFLSKQGDNK